MEFRPVRANVGRPERETLNLLAATDLLDQYWVEVQSFSNNGDPFPPLTVCMIMDVHSVLGAHDMIVPRGTTRSTPVGAVHPPISYLHPKQLAIDVHLTGLVDCWNEACQGPLTLLQRFQLAAWFLLRFLSIHPFAEGNGRMGRLLVNYLMRPALPFPISFFALGDHYASVRDIYLGALQAGRGEEGLKPPCQLMSFLIEAAWATMKSL